MDTLVKGNECVVNVGCESLLALGTIAVEGTSCAGAEKILGCTQECSTDDLSEVEASKDARCA